MTRYRNLMMTLLTLTATLLPAQTIVRYEYWVGDQTAGRVSVAESSETIGITLSTDALPRGLHYLNFRVQNS